MDIKSTNLVLLSFLLIITAIFGLNLQYSGAESNSDLQDQIESQDEESEDSSSTEKGSPGSDPSTPSSSVKDEPIAGVEADQQQENSTVIGKKPDPIEQVPTDFSTHNVFVQFFLTPKTESKEQNRDGIPREVSGATSPGGPGFGIHPEDRTAFLRQERFTDWTGNAEELYIVAYVQGIKIPIKGSDEPDGTPRYGITDWRTNPAGGQGGGSVEIDKTMPLSIMTVGYEVDGCKMPSFPANIQSRVIEALSNPVGDQYPGIKMIQNDILSTINSACVQGRELNDPLGSINKVYLPPSFGAGIHTEMSGGYPISDFEIKYKITVTPILPAAQE